MAIALTVAEIRHERRVRLFFTLALGGSAFVDLSGYTLENIDGGGTTPTVVAAFVVAGAPACVELQLDGDLTPSQAYRFSAVGIPGVDASVTPDPSDAFATFGERPEQLSTSTGSDLETLLYGEDVVFDGSEFSENSDGDLATISGPPNLRLALLRRGMSEGLPWDNAYGAKARQFVDGSPGAMPSLRAQMESALRADDRAASVKVTVDVDLEAGTGILLADVTPIGTSTPLATLPIPLRTS